jgi:hypothetical protein
VTVADQSETDHEVDAPCGFPCPNVDYSKGAPNECNLHNSVAEKLVTLSARGSYEKVSHCRRHEPFRRETSGRSLRRPAC